MAEKCIELKGITKAFDGQIVLDHMNLDIHENEFVTLLGPSGCGKTTTLRIMGGFETADEGQVLLNGTDIARLPANKRPINTVFQKYALFSHMNIEENIASTSQWKEPPIFTGRLSQRETSSSESFLPSKAAAITRPLPAPRSIARYVLPIFLTQSRYCFCWRLSRLF